MKQDNLQQNRGTRYEIHPRIGVARLGNSEDFYLAPESIGGLPIDCDQQGNSLQHNGEAVFVETFKDSLGRIKRQAAKFYIYAVDEAGNKRRISLADDDIRSIQWTVHVANKKPIWYTFSELQGNLEFGEQNSYENQHIPVNNPDVQGEARQKLIIDPGPQSIQEPGQQVDLSRYNIVDNYQTYGSFPPADAGGNEIITLGQLRMDDDGNLITLPGYGNVSGTAEITSFRGASGYWDDVCDGYVVATVTTASGDSFDVDPGWLMVGSPKYAPELVNITTLADTMFDVAVRKMNAEPELFGSVYATDANFDLGQEYSPLTGFNPNFDVNYHTHIKPVIERMMGYRWVADIPYLADFAQPGFDLTDNSESNKAARLRYFQFFRVPLLTEDYDEWSDKIENGPNQLFSAEGLPLMPLNSGDNSVTNSGPIYKFETLSPTQYFFMYQWAQGRFTTAEAEAQCPLQQLDEAAVGNCVGAPFSPGIETTWMVRSAPIYHQLMQIKLAHFTGDNQQLSNYYRLNGLSTTENETRGLGCEPGDLTKRMAIPWQSDFHECTVQTPNITNGSVNQFADGTGIEVPPAYYVYWWPPQSPMHVVAGSLRPDDQVLDGVVSQIADQSLIPAGQRVPYQRGIDTVQDMISNWSRLGFIVNQGDDQYPYFVEKERNNQAFAQQLAAKLGQK